MAKTIGPVPGITILQFIHDITGTRSTGTAVLCIGDVGRFADKNVAIVIRLAGIAVFLIDEAIGFLKIEIAALDTIEAFRASLCISTLAKFLPAFRAVIAINRLAGISPSLKDIVLRDDSKSDTRFIINIGLIHAIINATI